MLDTPQLLSMLELLLPGGGALVSAGGDFVMEHTGSSQSLHSDIYKPLCAFDVQFPPPFLCANFAVHAITDNNGPMMIIPGTQRVADALKRRGRRFPSTWADSKLSPLDPGDMLLRDVRVLHGGTPNQSTEARFLPSLDFALTAFLQSEEYKWPVHMSLPDKLMGGLSPAAQKWVWPGIVSKDELEVDWSTRHMRVRSNSWNW